ncbi:hypothetical protein L211DRAFT_702541 [Terfezia boudieri ATCC MYA-4762]|uniref:Uncharacterized protein n=1 Tax=Terfezia boudieri ATCC MYA-4762 TaxID=1051890 RepID=A0A3N4LZX7_9PEZI|nr:hypothetical protein L211DRAFT_702541 [Terfezia boudieri ATCC MYA-4762]
MEIGTVYKSMDLMKTGILKRHDEALVCAGYPFFGLNEECLTRLDFCIFRCNKNLVEGNIFHEEHDYDTEGEAVRGDGLLYPGAKVVKTGRTTGTTNGIIVSTDLVVWEGGLGSHEVCIMGDDNIPYFALKGDSGAVVMVKNEDMSLCLSAAGLLHGINRLKDLALATPLQIIMEEVNMKWM